VLELKGWPATIESGQTVVRWLGSDGTFWEPEWFGDGRLFRPGRYELQAFFNDSYIRSESILSPPTTIEEVRRKGIASTTA